VSGAGQTLITLGMLVLLFAGYEVYGKAWQVGADQGRLDQQLEQEWQQPAAGGAASTAADRPLTGSALARLYLPRLGKQWVVVEGVDLADIRLGPGHYPGTALPGKPGNFSIAGHRMPSVFWDLDKVRDGDVVGVETRTAWYLYRVSSTLIVTPDAVDVVAPVPGNAAAKPTKSFLTLTTCNPKWDNYQRLVVHALLVRQQPKAAGRPAELGG
jgi:sortase A